MQEIPSNTLRFYTTVLHDTYAYTDTRERLERWFLISFKPTAPRKSECQDALFYMKYSLDNYSRRPTVLAPPVSVRVNQTEKMAKGFS